MNQAVAALSYPNEIDRAMARAHPPPTLVPGYAEARRNSGVLIRVHMPEGGTADIAIEQADPDQARTFVEALSPTARVELTMRLVEALTRLGEDP